MSEDRDLERDLRLAAELGRVPAPAVPAGLAARIVANATRLPQHGDEAPAGIETAATTPTIASRRGRRWLAPAIGTALAASLLMALLMRHDSDAPGHPAAQTKVAQDAPAPLPAPAVGAPVAVEPGTPRLAVDSGLPGEPVRAPVTPVPQPDEPIAAAPSLSPGVLLAPPAESARPDAPLPVPANKPAPAGSASEPPEQAFVGPPDTEDLGGTLPEGSSTSGFGISGAGAPNLSAPPASGRGGRSGGMPRF